MTIWSAGYKVRSIQPLDKDAALSQGAEFVGEGVYVCIMEEIICSCSLYFLLVHSNLGLILYGTLPSIDIHSFHLWCSWRNGHLGI